MLPVCNGPTLCALLLASIPLITAQTVSRMFSWEFSGTQAVSTDLPSCGTFPISLNIPTGHAVPPFYMIAFAVGGTPITTLIGMNESDLSWTVSHPIGTRLFLGVVDSHGNTGGIATPLYTVTEGATTQCIQSETMVFYMTANVTDVLTTCAPWGLTVHGGMPPYTLTLAALDSSSVTNVTLGPNGSEFTYINRANPGSQLIASVSDSNGRWATGSPMVRTQGSSNVSCHGLESTVGGSKADPGTHTKVSSTAIGMESTVGGSKADSGTHTKISSATIGIITGALVGALFLCGLGIWTIRHKARLRAAKEVMTAVAPFPEPSNHSPTGRQIVTPPSAKSCLNRQSPTISTASGSNSPPSPSPIASPPVVVRGLPPPYAYLETEHQI
ncbi:hypothetical protein C8J57DRAFT_528442 [Mycena rebaudengoi]|nr:hypothetical protein C8J57DRAFT_528442 [Mycena rebaudengoi]